MLPNLVSNFIDLELWAESAQSQTFVWLEEPSYFVI